jgi:hypothetical protein
MAKQEENDGSNVNGFIIERTSGLEELIHFPSGLVGINGDFETAFD